MEYSNSTTGDVTIRAKYLKTIHEDDISGFCVFLCDVIVSENKTNTYIIKGYHLPSIRKVYYTYTGSWEKYNATYEFSVTSFSLEMPTSKESVIEFLSSPLIKQVGPKIAESIYNAFLDKTFEVIEHDYKKLTEVKGIKEQKARTIHESFMASKGVNTIYSLLGNAFTFKHATQIYSDCGNNLQKAIDTVTKKPYRLFHYRGITFKMVDELAKIYLNDPKDTGRIITAGKCVLNTCALSGNVGMPIVEFLKQTANMLNGDKGAYTEPDNKVDILSIKQVVGKYSAAKCADVKNGIVFVYQNKIIFQAKQAAAEQYIATKLRRLIKNFIPLSNSDGKYVIPAAFGSVGYYTMDELIAQYEEASHITLDAVQKQAVKQCFESGVSIVTGGPGTGKSTIMKAVLYIQNHINSASEVTLLAPTGRAAKRLSEATGGIASTIHSALHIIPDDENGANGCNCADTDVELSSDLVIVDEMSMTDMSVMYSLCKSVENGKRLVLVGDTEQLPSVGAGDVLHDLIRSGVIPTVKLQTIFRQSNGSSIVENASRINSGDTKLVYDKDFKFIAALNDNRRTDSTNNKSLYYSTAVDKVVNLYERAVDKFGIDNVVLLVPYRRRGYLSVNNLNPIIQSAINKSNLSGPCAKYGDNKFYINDRVMQTKNAKMTGENGEAVFVSNGEIGYVTNIYSTHNEEEQKDEVHMLVEYNGQKVHYTKETMQSLDLAYCQTVHKAQGGEFKIVLFGLMNEHARMLKRRVLYTGVTRGKNFVCLIGEKDALSQAIANNAEDEGRITLLCERLQGKAS